MSTLNWLDLETLGSRPICQKISLDIAMWAKQYSRLKSSMPFKRDLALQNTPLSKQPFITQPQVEYEDVT